MGDETHIGNNTLDTEKTTENGNIEKAMRFWKHPALRDLPTEQKFAYLRQKGVTDAEIHKAWDRIIAEDDERMPPVNSSQNDMNLVSSPATYASQHPTHSSPQSPPLSSGISSSQTGYQQPYRGGYYDPHQPGFYPHRDDDDGPISMVQGISLVAVGSALGLTAAAAARWLNGGDFQILPSPTNQSLEERPQIVRDPDIESSAEDVDDGDVEDGDSEEGEAVEDDDDAILLPPLQEKFIEKLDSISDTFQSYVGVQEKILQKLSSNSSITNSSMDMLRSSSSVRNGKKGDDDLISVWVHLVEVKAELRSFNLSTPAKDSPALEAQISKSLSKLDDCLERVVNAIEANGSKMPMREARGGLTARETTNNSINAPSTERTVKTASNGKSTISDGTEAIVSLTLPSPTLDSPVHGKQLDEEKNDVIDSSRAEMTPVTSPPAPQQVGVVEELHGSNETATSDLYEAVKTLARDNDPTSLRIGSQIMYLYFVNLSNKPDNMRYRKIYTSNESFQKIEKLKGAKDLLLSVGFQEEKGYLEWLPNCSAEQETSYLPRLKEGVSVLSILKSGKTNLEEAALAALAPNDT